MWNTPHAAPNSTPGRKVIQEASSPAISMNTSSPAYMLPNSRIDNDTGLDRYSTRFRMTFGINSATFPTMPSAWKGDVISSLVKPPAPLALIE